MKITRKDIENFELKNNIDLPKDYISFLLTPDKGNGLLYSYEAMRRTWDSEGKYVISRLTSEVTRFIPFFSREIIPSNDYTSRDEELHVIFNRSKKDNAEIIDDKSAELLYKLQQYPIDSLSISSVSLNDTKFLPIAYNSFQSVFPEKKSLNAYELLLLNVDSSSSQFGAIFNWTFLDEIPSQSYYNGEEEVSLSPINEFSISYIASSFSMFLRNVDITTYSESGVNCIHDAIYLKTA